MPNKLNQMLVDQITRGMSKLDNVVIIDYQGLNSLKMAQFRSELRKAKLTMEVVKNRIASTALKAHGLKPLIEHDKKLPRKQQIFRGPTAVLFGGDGTVDIAKFTTKWMKENKDTIKVKAGQMGHDVLDVKQVEASATLPGRKELLSTLAGDFLALPQKMAATLQAGYARIAYGFNALANKLEKK
ncbi:MAG: 50S ribosomal protein L10 [Planctomycetes bacterium]|nr:50S ribosomal protein L10 [Planctomycetota bacterium]